MKAWKVLLLMLLSFLVGISAGNLRFKEMKEEAKIDMGDYSISSVKTKVTVVESQLKFNQKRIAELVMRVHILEDRYTSLLESIQPEGVTP